MKKGISMQAVGLYRYLPIEEEASLTDLDLECDLLVQVKAVSVIPAMSKIVPETRSQRPSEP